MARVKTGTVRKAGHKKVLELAKGFRMSRHRLYRIAQEALLHAQSYAFAGRKHRKQDFRKLWIVRIKAALGLQEQPVSYSKFINMLKVKNVKLNRKSLSTLASSYPQIFTNVFKFTSR